MCAISGSPTMQLGIFIRSATTLLISTPRRSTSQARLNRTIVRSGAVRLRLRAVMFKLHGFGGPFGSGP